LAQLSELMGVRLTRQLTSFLRPLESGVLLKVLCTLAFTRYSFSARPLYTNQYY